MAGVLLAFMTPKMSCRRLTSSETMLRLLVGGPGHFRQKVTTVELPYKKLSDISEARANQPGSGKVYDKKPFKVSLIKGKKYAWCVCGWSKWQPFCDGSHANPHFRVKLLPLIFIAPESRDYWLCNCKQTAQRPFCDGTHRNEEIQSKIRS